MEHLAVGGSEPGAWPYLSASYFVDRTYPAPPTPAFVAPAVVGGLAPPHGPASTPSYSADSIVSVASVAPDVVDGSGSDDPVDSGYSSPDASTDSEDSSPRSRRRQRRAAASRDFLADHSCAFSSSSCKSHQGGWSTDDPPTASTDDPPTKSGIEDAPVQVTDRNLGPTLTFGPPPRSHEGSPRGPTAGAASAVARPSHGPRHVSSRRQPPPIRTAFLTSPAGPRGGGEYFVSPALDRLPVRGNLGDGRTHLAPRLPPNLRARDRHRAQNTSPLRDAPRRQPELRTAIDPVWRRAVPRDVFVDEDRLSSNSDARPKSRPPARPTVGIGPPDGPAPTPSGKLRHQARDQGDHDDAARGGPPPSCPAADIPRATADGPAGATATPCANMGSTAGTPGTSRADDMLLVPNPFDDGSALQTVAGSTSGDTDVDRSLLLQLEDACAEIRGALSELDRARVDGLLNVRARSQATAGGTSLAGELARFANGAAADDRSRKTVSRDRYARARVTKAYLWPGQLGPSLTSDDIRRGFDVFFTLLLSAKWVPPTPKRKRLPAGTSCALVVGATAPVPDSPGDGATLELPPRPEHEMAAAPPPRHDAESSAALSTHDTWTTPLTDSSTARSRVGPLPGVAQTSPPLVVADGAGSSQAARDGVPNLSPPSRPVLPSTWGRSLNHQAACWDSVSAPRGSPRVSHSDHGAASSHRPPSVPRWIQPPPPPEFEESDTGPPSPDHSPTVADWRSALRADQVSTKAIVMNAELSAYWGRCVATLDSVRPIAPFCPMPSCRSAAPVYGHMLRTFTDPSLDDFFWERACSSDAEPAVRLHLHTSPAYKVSHVALGDGLVLVPRLGANPLTDQPMAYACLCYASSLHHEWHAFSPDPFTTRMLMLRILTAVAARMRSMTEHRLFELVKLRVSTEPCTRSEEGASSIMLADLHDQCIRENLQPIGTFLSRASHAALIFRALLLGAPYDGLRADILDQMVGASLAAPPPEDYSGYGAVTSTFCPALVNSALFFASPAQRMAFLRCASRSIRGVGAPPCSRSPFPDHLEPQLYDPGASSSSRTYARGGVASSLGFHTPPGVVQHRLRELRTGYPTADSEYREPAAFMAAVYRRAEQRAAAAYPLDPPCEAAWRLWYSPHGGVVK